MEETLIEMHMAKTPCTVGGHHRDAVGKQGLARNHQASRARRPASPLRIGETVPCRAAATRMSMQMVSACAATVVEHTKR